MFFNSLCPNIIYIYTVYPKKYAHGLCFAVLCCGYTLTDFPISIWLTSLALWQCNDCPSASKATLMNMDKYFMWIHYERLHNHNKAKHNKTVCIFLGIYCINKFRMFAICRVLLWFATHWFTLIFLSYSIVPWEKIRLANQAWRMGVNTWRIFDIVKSFISSVVG